MARQLKNRVGYSKQHIDRTDIEAVIDVLSSNFLTQGPKKSEFEKRISKYFGSPYTTTVSNGTAALHLAMLAADVKAGDAIITPSLTFAATANAVLYANATPIFADIDPHTGLLDPVSVEKALDIAKSHSLRPKAIIPVHYAGLPCDINNLNYIAQTNNMLIIEDACHAVGSDWKTPEGKWKKIGDHSSDLTIFSFHAVKNITTGEGGAILTAREDLHKKIQILASHGITKDSDAYEASSFHQELYKDEHCPWYHQMLSLGFNYRLNELSCALGISQLKKLNSFITKKKALADIYSHKFSHNPFIKTPIYETNASISSLHLYPIQVNFQDTKLTKPEFMRMLSDLNVNTQVHYIPVHLHPYYQNNKGKWLSTDLTNTTDFYQRVLSLPLYPDLTEQEVEIISDNINELISS